MRKTLISIIMSIVSLTYLLTACDSNKSLQQKLQEEKRAIDRYISRNGLVILNEYPKDGVFKEKEFFKTNDGLYIHVVDSGGRKVQPLRDEVTVRFEYRHDILESDTSIVYWDKSGLVYPYSFKYGLSQSYKVSGSLVCTGWVIPLQYVGEYGVLDLIIPSSLGSYEDSYIDSYAIVVNPVFYKGLTYTKFY
ncbi:hypothetical protein FACS189451_06800 [Bacteroidia bacterium]|nr:hypothetical protein FACS189451_06800 [Bacteroidia bacterium]